MNPITLRFCIQVRRLKTVKSAGALPQPPRPVPRCVQGLTGLVVGGTRAEALSRKTVALDCAVLALVVLISAVPYTCGLGFYFDDWSFLAALAFPPSQSLIGSFQSMYALGGGLEMRPVQILYWAMDSRLFGLHPLGYHALNTALLTAAIAIFYLTLSEARVPRLTAFGIALIYGMAPHYNADRFWIANSEVNLSLGLAYLAVLAGLKGSDPDRRNRLRWQAVCVVSLLAALLAYEAALPVLALMPVAIWWRRRIAHGSQAGVSAACGSVPWFIGSIAAAVLALVAFKFFAQTKIHFRFQFLSHLPAVIAHVISETIRFNFGPFGFELPRLMATVCRGPGPTSMTLAAAGALGVLSFTYLGRIAREGCPPPGRRECIALMILAPFVFWGANIFFLHDVEWKFALNGTQNRVYALAAIAPAMTAVGLVGLLATVPRDARLERYVFSSLIAGLCLCSSLILGTLAQSWQSAYRDEVAILSQIQRAIPNPPPSGTIILDGSCAGLGYFESAFFDDSMDFSGALRLRYGRGDIGGDVVRCGLTIGLRAISIPSGGEASAYQYGGGLIAYDVADHKAYLLYDAVAARGYFETTSLGYRGRCAPNDGEPRENPASH